MNFRTDIQDLRPARWESVIHRLRSGDLSLQEAAGLLSPEADAHLEEMAQAAHVLTTQRFGKTIKLYAPVYLSNECINGCVYCGFRAKNAIERRTLTVDEALEEAHAVIERGHRHLLLVSGEHPQAVAPEFIADVARRLRPQVAGLAVEIQPFEESVYHELSLAGVDGVTLYQETYDEEAYARFHPTGPKSRFGSRIAAMDAAGRAGMRFLGIGALLGLSDWRGEALHLIAHARQIMRTHWRSAITISVPRIRDCAASFKPPHPVSDRELTQMITALRLSLPDAGIVLSTRENAVLRDALLPLGITQMSCGSVTAPGGHAIKPGTGEQFHIEDGRNPAEFAAMLRQRGYDPVWKDWEPCLSDTPPPL